MVLHAILVAGAASALVLGPLQGQAPLPTLYPIDQAHSQIGFSVRFMGLSRVRGTLANFSGSIMYDGRDAIGIFQLTLEPSPNDPNLLDSLGEGYVAAGDRARPVPLAKWLSQSTAFAGSKPDRLVRRQANS